MCHLSIAQAYCLTAIASTFNNFAKIMLLNQQQTPTIPERIFLWIQNFEKETQLALHIYILCYIALINVPSILLQLIHTYTYTYTPPICLLPFNWRHKKCLTKVSAKLAPHVFQSVTYRAMSGDEKPKTKCICHAQEASNQRTRVTLQHTQRTQYTLNPSANISVTRRSLLALALTSSANSLRFVVLFVFKLMFDTVLIVWRRIPQIAAIASGALLKMRL